VSGTTSGTSRISQRTSGEAFANAIEYAPEPPPAAGRLLDLAALSGCPLVRLSIQRADPNFEVHWPLAELKKLPASTVFETLRKLGEQA